MHIVVVGAGGMGSLFGARLAAAGHDVLLYDTWSEHIQAIQERGLFIESADGTPIRYQVAATDSPPQALRGADLVLVQVKSYDTQKALMPLEKRFNPESMILSLQNGLGNLEAMRRVLPNHPRLLLGVTSHGAGIVSPGRIRHAGPGPTVIGDPMLDRSPKLTLSPIRDAFNQAGFDTEMSDNIMSHIWLKLAANISINPLSALTGVTNGQLLEDPALLELADAAVGEMVAVMRASGTEPEGRDYTSFARQVMRDTGTNRSSMYRDIVAGRRTEIDAMSGAVAALGAELGVQTPVNRWLTALVRNRERAIRDAAREG